MTSKDEEEDITDLTLWDVAHDLEKRIKEGTGTASHIFFEIIRVRDIAGTRGYINGSERGRRR